MWVKIEWLSSTLSLINLSFFLNCIDFSRKKFYDFYFCLLIIFAWTTLLEKWNYIFTWTMRKTIGWIVTVIKTTGYLETSSISCHRYHITKGDVSTSSFSTSFCFRGWWISITGYTELVYIVCKGQLGSKFPEIGVQKNE